MSLKMGHHDVIIAKSRYKQRIMRILFIKNALDSI